MTVPLVIDTDTAADDCFALLFGLRHPNADLRAITIVAGNVGFDQQVHNAFLTMEKAGRAGEVPVHVGARDPLVAAWVSAEDVHGDGVGGERRAGRDEPSAEHAVDALLRLAREHSGELVIVAIGPLTNLALAIRRDPRFADDVAELIVMGGSLNARGNITAAAEYNIYVDPEAAAIVVGAGFARLRFVTWDPLTLTQALFDDAQLAELDALDTDLSRFFTRANRASYEFDVAAGIPGSTHPDSLSVFVALEPSVVIEERPYRVAIELRGEHTRGATVFDWIADASVHNATAIERVDSTRFFTAFRELLAGR